MQRRIPISVFLGFSIGTLLAVSLAIVISYLSFQTRQIIGDEIQLEARQRVERLRDAVDGSLDEIEQFARAAHAGLATVDNTDDQDAMLRALLTSRTMPTSLRLGTLTVSRDAQGTIRSTIDENNVASVDSSGWSVIKADGALVFSLMTEIQGAGGMPLQVTVFFQEISQKIASVIDIAQQRAFVLADLSTVIAHSAWADTGYGSGSALTLATTDDLDLRTIWVNSDEYWPMRSEGAHLDRGDTTMRAYVYEATERPDIVLTVGYHARASVFGAPITENTVLALIAAGVLVVSVTAGVLMTIAISRPIQRLAVAARQIEDLSVETTPNLRHSLMRELDDANGAFLSAFRALAAFARFVPRDVVRQVMDGSAIGANQTEIRRMTIMFTDLAGFTSIAENNAPDETAALLNEHFEMLTSIIDREGGTIDKFLGDGVMAFWGAPGHQPDHAQRALRAAAAIASKFEKFADERLRLRIGIATGDVLVGLTGSNVRMNYTVIGDTVNIAARLQDLGKVAAADARVVALAGGQTIDAAGSSMRWTSLGDQTLRGRDKPTEVYRLNV